MDKYAIKLRDFLQKYYLKIWICISVGAICYIMWPLYPDWSVDLFSLALLIFWSAFLILLLILDYKGTSNER